jgi:hypothetical protein
MRKRPQRDAIAAYQRRVTAARRIGVDVKCLCGESRPAVLIPGSKPTICCHACRRKQHGKTEFDQHHVAAGANSHAKTPIWVNDHVAILSDLQFDWPEATLENRDGSPLLAAAGRTRGYTETNEYLSDTLLRKSAEMLEALDKYLVKRLGPNWWRGTELEKFAPER